MIHLSMLGAEMKTAEEGVEFAAVGASGCSCGRRGDRHYSATAHAS
jgi:hypothetical protein